MELLAILMFIGTGALWSVFWWLSYTPNSSIIVGLLCAVLDAVLWLVLAHHTTDASRLLLYNLIWNIVGTAAGVIIPVLFFGVKLTPQHWLGISLIFGGLFLTRSL